MTEALRPEPVSVELDLEADHGTTERRTARLLTGLRSVADRAGGLDGERLLFLLGAVAIPLGAILLCIAWYGTAGTGAVFEQMPYVVSGGLGGLALILVGCTLYGCWWVTRAIRDQRERHARLVDQNEQMLVALQDLTAEVAKLASERKGR